MLTRSKEAARRTGSQELGREQGVSVEWGQSFSLGKMESSGGRWCGWMLILLSCALERGQMASVRHSAFYQD